MSGKMIGSACIDIVDVAHELVTWKIAHTTQMIVQAMFRNIIIRVQF